MDWDKLEHAYGPAGDVPALLEKLTPNETDSVWDDLWSRICHQGTVYNSSYPTLPYLDAVAKEWSIEGKISPIFLASRIVSSSDAPDNKDKLLAPYMDSVESLKKLTKELLKQKGLSQSDYVYLLQSALSFEDESILGDRLEDINSGEFPGYCPHCDEYLYILIGEYGFYVSSEDWINKSSIEKQEIISCSEDKLPTLGRWLVENARDSNQEMLSQWFPYIFGKSICPKCSSGIDIYESISNS